MTNKSPGRPCHLTADSDKLEPMNSPSGSIETCIILTIVRVGVTGAGNRIGGVIEPLLRIVAGLREIPAPTSIALRRSRVAPHAATCAAEAARTRSVAELYRKLGWTEDGALETLARWPAL